MFLISSVRQQRNRSGPRSTLRSWTKQDVLLLDHISFIKNWLKSRVTDVSSLMFFLCFIILFLLLLCVCLLTSRSLRHQTDTKSLLGLLCKTSSTTCCQQAQIILFPLIQLMWFFDSSLRVDLLSWVCFYFEFKTKWVELKPDQH